MSGVLRVRWLWSGVVEDIPVDEFIDGLTRSGKGKTLTLVQGDEEGRTS